MTTYECTDCLRAFNPDGEPYVLGPHLCDDPGCPLTGHIEVLCPTCAEAEQAYIAKYAPKAVDE